MTDRSVAAVTGASRGIGRETALALARSGYRVFALARTTADLQELAGEAQRQGWTIEPVELDIADESSRQAAAEAIMAATDGYGLDVLVNNAGYGLMGPMEEIPAESLRRLFEVNLIGLLAFTQPFLPQMRQRRQGWVVQLSSTAGRVSLPFMGSYNASKFALEGMSDAMRLELAPFGVHVVLIEPGPIPTNFGQAGEHVVKGGSPYARFYRRYLGMHGSVGLFGRSPANVASVILRAVETDHPRARYTITLPAKIAWLERLVPVRLRDFAMRLALGLFGKVD